MFIEIRSKTQGDNGENDRISEKSFEKYVQLLFNTYIYQQKIKFPKIQKINIDLTITRNSEIKKPLFSVCDVYIHVNENEYINLSYYDKFNWVVDEIISVFIQISNNLGIENSDSIKKLNEEVKQKIDSFEYTIHKLKYSPTKKVKSRVFCIMTNEKAIVYIEYGLKTFKTSKLLEMSNVYYYVYKLTNDMIRDENDNLVFILKHESIKQSSENSVFNLPSVYILKEDLMKISFDCNTEEIKYEIEEEKLNENLIWFKNMNININGKYLV